MEERLPRSSEQLGRLLAVNDGWGELLAKGGLGGEELGEFYAFMDRGFPKEEGVEVITLKEDDRSAFKGRTDVLDLPVDTLGDQLRRFRLLGLIDPEWLVHPEVASVFSSYKGLSPERLNKLILVARSFQSVIPIEGREGVSIWTTILLTSGLAKVVPKDRAGREIEIGLLKELLFRDIFSLSRNLGGTVITLGLKKEDDWMVTLRKNGSLVHPIDPAQPGQIGHCCFTVTMLSEGLEEERRALALKGVSSEEVLVRLGKVMIGRIRYDQYEPKSTRCITLGIKEYDNGTGIPKTKLVVSINKKRHPR